MRNYNRKRKPKHSIKSGYKFDFGGRLVFFHRISKAQNIKGYWWNYKYIRYLGKIAFYCKSEVVK